MAASEYIKTVSVADTVVQEVAGRNVVVTKSTIDAMHGDDIELHHSIASTVTSENDVWINTSMIGNLRGRIIKSNKSISLYTKAEVMESKNSFAFIANVDTVQGTMFTLFTKTTAAIFAGVLLLGYQILKRQSRH